MLKWQKSVAEDIQHFGYHLKYVGENVKKIFPNILTV